MTANALYHPDWQTELAAAEAALAQARRAEAMAARDFGGPGHRAALAVLEAAKQQHFAVFLTQFKRIADYASWRFAGLETDSDAFALTYEEADFTSLAAVDAAYERALQHRREGTLEQNFRLTVGQPVGLAAFAARDAVISSWRAFGRLDCMVSGCMVGEQLHICLAHPWGGLALKSNEIFRNIASQLAREVILLRLPEAEAVFAPGGHQLMQHRDTIRAANALAATLRFYRHLLPERNLREEFCRVEMVWNGINWIDPDWSAQVYDVLPVALREAAGQPPLLSLGGARGAFTPPRITGNKG